MKRWIAFLFLLGSLEQGTGQTVFTYGPYKVSSQEFLRAYHKNSTGNTNYLQSITEYLELYIRFRLKVRAAYDLRLDTLPNQKADAISFGQQIEDAYLTDTVMQQKMLSEAWQRSLKDIDLSHIYIPFRRDQDAGSPIRSEDSLKARQQMLEVQQKLKAGVSFESLAASYSADPDLMRNKGRLGYVTVFTLPYALENVAYGLRVGQVSEPVTTRAGYHFLRKNGERPAVGRVKLAQILIAFAPPAGPAERAEARKLADSLYKVLQSGGDFAALAGRFSNDRNSFSVGGMLPEFGIGQYEPAFEEAAFALQREGEISQPVETAFGYHILRKAGHTPVEQDPLRAAPGIRQDFQADGRSVLPRQSFQQLVLTKINYRKSAYRAEDLWNLTDEFLAKGVREPSGSLALSGALFTLAGKKYTVDQWLNYLRETEATPDRRQYPAQLDSFVARMGISYYRENLEKFNPQYQSQMTEFREGNLLFEVMEKQVWSRAAQDTAGLRRYYEEHKGKYNWAPSADILVFTASDGKTGMEALAALKKDPLQWRKLLEAQAGRLMGDSARMEISQIGGLGMEDVKAGAYSQLSAPDPDGAVTFGHVLRVYTRASPRSFEDARGMVMNDYQLFLEEKWVESLRKKYPVVVNQPEWQKILSLR